MVRKVVTLEAARHRVYSTSVGIGVDFNAALIERLSATHGCNRRPSSCV